jgi:hypothetical protein
MIVLIILILLLGLGLYLLLRKKDSKSNAPKMNNIFKTVSDKIDKTQPTETYISPTNFNVGPIKMDTYKSSNLCNDKVLYPINGLDVDYGSKVPNNYACMQFIQSP